MALAVPSLTVRERNHLLKFGNRVSVWDAHEFLAGLNGRRDLADTFNTTRRRRRLGDAASRFEERTTQWLAGSYRDPTMTWLIPNELARVLMRGQLTSEMLTRILRYAAAQYESSNHQAATLAARYLVTMAGIDHNTQWLPYLSLQNIRLLHRLSRADISLLRAALGRAAYHKDMPMRARPWTPEFPLHYRCVPTSWLYTFDQQTRLETIIVDLARAGCPNVGHLAIAYPHLHYFIKEQFDERAWTLITTTLADHLGIAMQSSSLNLPASPGA